MDGIAAAGSILQVIFSVTKLAKQLNEVREGYGSVALNTTLVASQLSTIRAALEALHDWRSNDRELTDHSQQLDKDLEVSLSCCAILITVIDGKLGEAGYKPGVKQKIRYLWLEDILREYLSNLEGQVRALQLLLTIYQCKTATEKRQKLARAESRKIIENVRARTQTLRSDNKDFQDAASVLSLDPSVHFDFDSVLMKTPAYINAYGERPSRKPPPVADRSLKPSQWQRTSIWNPYLGQEVHIGTLSSKDSGDHECLPAQQIDEESPEKSSTIRQGQQAASTIGSPLSDGEDTRDDQISGASGPSEDGRGESMHSAVDDLTAAGGLGLSTVAALTQDIVSLAAAGDPTTVPRSSSPAKPDTTDEQDDEKISSPVSHPAPTLGGLRQAISDHTKGNDSDMTSSALDNPNHRMESAVENKSPSKQVNNIPRVFYGPNKITESSMYQDTYIELDAATPTSLVRIPTVQGQDLNSVSEAEGFKTLGTKIDIVAEVPKAPQQANSFATDSAPTNVTEEAARLSTSNAGLSDSVNRIGSTRSASGAIYPDVSTNLEKAMQPLPIPDGPVVGMLQMPEASSDEAVRRENLPSTSSNVLATRAGLEIPKSSDQLNKRTTDGSNVTPSIGLGLTTLEDPNIRERPLQLDTSVSTTIESSSPPPPRRRPPLPPLPPVPSTVSQLSSPASQIPLTPMSSTTGTELYTFSESSQDSCVTGSSSCPSTSDLPEVNTADNIQYYTDNCTATSSGIDPPLTLREQGQILLRNLRTQLEAAKARGDSKSQEDAIQKSIDVIWRTQLSPRDEPATTQMTKQKAPSPKPKKKASMIRFPLLTSSTKSEALGQAAADGDEATLTRLLSENAHVNCTSLGSKTPMMRAAMNGRVQCMSILKESGADEFAVDKSGATALHHAILSNKIPAVKWLLETYPPSEVVRHRSSIRSRMDTGNWGRSQRNLREMPDMKGLRPLHIAVEHDTGGMVETLLAAGADMEAKNKQGQTPLIHAILSSRRDSFNTLLRSGARIDQTDALGMSALHCAAGLGQVATITTLLEKGAGRLVHDMTGHEPIHIAASRGHILAVEALITEGSDLDRPTKSGDSGNGESLLHIASLYNHLDLARYLLKNGVQVNYWADPTLWCYHPRSKLLGSSLTPLHYACCLGHFEMAALLLDHNALVNAATVDGYTPLMMAVEAENTDLVNLLHSRGAKVNASLPGTLSTALHMAARRGDIETVRELCRAGADFKARAGKDSYGRRTPLEICGDCHDNRKRSEVRDYLTIVLHNDSVKRGVLTQSAHYGQPQQQAPLVQQARNSTFYQEPAPPPPYSKAPPAWR